MLRRLVVLGFVGKFVVVVAAVVAWLAGGDSGVEPCTWSVLIGDSWALAWAWVLLPVVTSGCPLTIFDLVEA